MKNSQESSRLLEIILLKQKCFKDRNQQMILLMIHCFCNSAIEVLLLEGRFYVTHRFKKKNFKHNHRGGCQRIRDYYQLKLYLLVARARHYLEGDQHN